MKTDELDRLVAAGTIREIDREHVMFIVRRIVALVATRGGCPNPLRPSPDNVSRPDHLTAGAHLIDNLAAYLVEAEFVTAGFRKRCQSIPGHIHLGEYTGGRARFYTRDT